MSLRVAMVVPDYAFEWDDARHCCYWDLQELCRNGRVDLVVLPECYAVGKFEEFEAYVAEWAEELGVPVLMGLGTEDGFQLAYYLNPNPNEGETRSHVYVKHSTAERLAYEWPGYAGVRDKMFDPIRLGDELIGVQICHDMYFGLIGQQERARGATMYVDLTGGGVNERKWRNVIAGRSLELDAPFLCTMAKRPGEGGAAKSIVYVRGQPLEFNEGYAAEGAKSGFDLYDLGDAVTVEDVEQPFTEQKYNDIRVAYRGAGRADITLDLGSRGLELSGVEVKGAGEWRGFQSSSGTVGVLALPIAALRDGLAIHGVDCGPSAFAHHLVVYYGENGSPPDATIALMRLRVIEHRVGLIWIAADEAECVKTNRYKNIQRFHAQDGVFGLDAKFLGGTWSTAGATSSLGIPRNRFAEYRALIPGRS